MKKTIKNKNSFSNSNFKLFKNKKVIITGFNGFKGSWLSIWLSLLGAKVYGISLKNKNKNNHYNIVKSKLALKEIYIDIRDKKKFVNIFKKINPDFVFHLAAQSLVYNSIKKPSLNWETNVIGFLNILIALNNLKKKCTAILITSDKCYKNYEKKKGYYETDELGGEDPYSASKASSEILFNSFFKTYIKNQNNYLRIATARAGNVVGGGDWSELRLIPDCMKKWLKNKNVLIRNPYSTRPWQHVLEALNGYLLLAENLNKNKKLNGSSFNFSSNKIKNVTVVELISKINKIWPQAKWQIMKKTNFHETAQLQLNSSKAKKSLNWEAKLNLNQTISFIVSWYKNYQTDKKNTFYTSKDQIIKFMKKS